MVRDPKNSHRRRPRSGAVTHVSAKRGEERPVRIECRDHAHHYEFAWRDTDDGPVITDLRVTSDDGSPITDDSLRRINTVRLARAARTYDTDAAADIGHVVGDAMEIALADAMSNSDPTVRVAAALAYIENDDSGFGAAVAAGMRQSAQAHDLRDLASRVDDWYANRGQSFIIRSTERQFGKRRSAGGRPPLTRDFLAQIADWARQASDMQEPYYAYIADRVDEREGWRPSRETIKVWIKRCKDPNDVLGADALGKDELRRSRTPRREEH